MFLTAEELRELTGYQVPAHQKRWLSDRGWVFVVSAFGRPKVSRAYAEQRLGVAVIGVAAQTSAEPDFSHWKLA